MIPRLVNRLPIGASNRQVLRTVWRALHRQFRRDSDLRADRKTAYRLALAMHAEKRAVGGR